jgi:RHS repeat-associated protein
VTYDGSNNWKQNFVFGQDLDEVLMLEQADALDCDSDSNTSELTRSFYHRNALGSVMDIIDALEATIESYRYDPYGNASITMGGVPQSSDPLGQSWCFSGRFRDAESGLIYVRARYYSPPQGRFSQRDMLGYGPGPNLYQYAFDRPTTLTDPLGLAPRPPSTRTIVCPACQHLADAFDGLADSELQLDADVSAARLAVEAAEDTARKAIESDPETQSRRRDAAAGQGPSAKKFSQTAVGGWLRARDPVLRGISQEAQLRAIAADQAAIDNQVAAAVAANPEVMKAQAALEAAQKKQDAHLLECQQAWANLVDCCRKKCPNCLEAYLAYPLDITPNWDGGPPAPMPPGKRPAVQ